MNQPRVFIASSSEAKNVADWMQVNFENDPFDVEIWDQHSWITSKSILDKLLDSLPKYDFAIFIFAFEDETKLREEDVKTVRDNVLFELGLSMGIIGRDRSFIVMPKEGEKNYHIPKDLEGILALYYNPEKENLQAALGPSCTKIREIIGKLKPRKIEPQPLVEPSQKTPSSKILNDLINETLEVICRAMSVPATPDAASLRVFIFEGRDDQLICTHFWSQNPTKEHVGRTKFDITEETKSKVSVVKAYITGEITREEINPNEQLELAKKEEVSDKMEYVISAPIFNDNESVWGVVDFDTLCETGKQLLITDVSTAALFKLSKYLQLLFSLQNETAAD